MKAMVTFRVMKMIGSLVEMNFYLNNRKALPHSHSVTGMVQLVDSGIIQKNLNTFFIASARLSLSPLPLLLPSKCLSQSL